MAQQILDTGTGNNTGDGDPLRVAMGKTNDNFTELYAQRLGFVAGWGYYKDAETTPATQTINTTPSKLQIDGASVLSDSTQLPDEILGSAELWDVVNDKITPISSGDSYDCRIDFGVASKTGSPTFIDFILDIGGGASPSIQIIERIIGLPKTPPFSVSVGFTIFALSTFLTNGGQIFLSTDTGTVTIDSRAIFIKRDYKGK